MIASNKEIDWAEISEKISRSSESCLERWNFLKSASQQSGNEQRNRCEEEKLRSLSMKKSSQRTTKHSRQSKIDWSEEDDKKLFMKFKEKGTKWTVIAQDFPNRTENEIKNRFYSTLRRVATKRAREKQGFSKNSAALSKEQLIDYVEEAMQCGHNCFSKRGRKKKKVDKKERNEELQINHQQASIVHQGQPAPAPLPTQTSTRAFSSFSPVRNISGSQPQVPLSFLQNRIDQILIAQQALLKNLMEIYQMSPQAQNK